MNSVKSATLGSLAMAKDVVNPEHLGAGLMAAAEKGKGLAEAVEEVAEHVSHYPTIFSLSAVVLVFISMMLSELSLAPPSRRDEDS